jgi:hypothetical protein
MESLFDEEPDPPILGSAPNLRRSTCSETQETVTRQLGICLALPPFKSEVPRRSPVGQGERESSQRG